MNFMAPLLILAGCNLLAADLVPHNAEAIARAMASNRQAAERVAKDPNRPTYHVLAPAHWINDPNGPIFHNGFWHLFYQHNPYGDQWGHMHWGHARSKDLAHWEHLPIALWPSQEVGEEHVFSGCAAIRDDGTPVIFYTSIGRGKSAGEYAEQWMALGDSNLLKWRKPSSNPALAPSLHGATKIWDWRDPFLFKYQGADYMVLGGNLNQGKGGAAIVALYKAKDPTLTQWEYLGILFQHPDPKVTNIECPNFFELDGKWVLIISPHRRVEFFLGDFDGKKFTSQTQGLLDHSDNFYAPNSTIDPKGRRILWGWARGFKDRQGWNGALTLPRELKTDGQGKLYQAPARELAQLHRRELLSLETNLTPEKRVSVSIATPQLLVSAEFIAGNNSGLRLFKTASHPGLEISYSNGTIQVGDKKAPHNLWVNDTLRLEVFVDHSLVEVYANGTFSFTTVHYPPSYDGTVDFYSTDRNSILKTKIFELDSAW